MQLLRPAFPIVCAMILASCSTEKIAGVIPGVYHIDVHQGNVVTQEMIDQLKPNMNKRQVTYIMGTPMLVDVFHKDRWDYLYSNAPRGENREFKRISLRFENDELVGLDGDFRPNDLPVTDKSKETTLVIDKLREDPTLWGTLKRWFGYGDT